jgi:acyl carrier protein
MVFWGRNVYPQDVEMTAWSCHPSLKENGCAAFAVEAEGRERLVVVQEVVRPNKVDLEAVADAVRHAVQAEHRVPLYALVFIKPGTLPKTSSGKVQRNAARDRFLNDELTMTRQWRFPVAGDPGAAAPAPAARAVSRPEVRDWLVARIARHCKVPAAQIDADEAINSYVMDSVSAVMIAAELQEWLGRAVSPTVLYDNPSLSVLAGRLADPLSPTPDSVEDLTPDELDEVLARLLDNAAQQSGGPPG